MKIAIGSDHSAHAYKRAIIELFSAQGHEFVDFGGIGDGPCDYPLVAGPVARAVRSGECERGVLICGTGLGMSYAANKVRGIRAAVCSEPVSATLARQHNDAQIICFGARIVGLEMAVAITRAFLDTRFSGDARHAQRIAQIDEIEGGD